MKKQFITAALVLFVIVTKSQPPNPPKPPSIEERLRKTNEVLKNDVQVTTAQQTKLQTVFKDFFTQADKVHKNHPPPPPPPPDPKVKEAMDKLVKDRDEKIKAILTEEQFKKFKEAEKKLHPPPPGGSGGQSPPPPPGPGGQSPPPQH